MDSLKIAVPGAGTREGNELDIIAALRQRGMMTKSEIAGQLGLTRQGVNVIVGELVLGGFLKEGGRKSGSVGRSSAYYALDPAAAFSVGVVIEADRIELMLVDFLGAAHYRATAALPGDGGEMRLAVLDGAVAAIRRHCADAGIAWSRIAGLGALTAGRSLEPEPGARPDGQSALLKAQLEAAFGLKVQLAKRAAASAAAELLKGEGALPGSFIFLCCEQGLGSALMIGGEVHGGEHGGAMQIDRFPVRTSDGLSLRAGEIATVDVLRARLLAAGAAGDDLYAANVTHPAIVSRWIAEAGSALASVLACIHLAVDVGAVVIDSGLPGALAFRLVERLSGELAESLPEGIVAPQVVVSRLGRDAAVLGAAIQPLHLQFGPPAAARSRRSPLRAGHAEASP
jgi:predicted NBD/HSP70 family sugar kinase